MAFWRRILDYLTAAMRSIRARRGPVQERAADGRIAPKPLSRWRREQVARLGVLFAVLVIALLPGRTYLIPTRFKDVELHRQATVDRELQRPVRFAGAVSCGDCHDDQLVQKRRGHHRNLACESCHGPCYAHTQDPVSVTPYAPRTRDLCPQCHAYDASRPTGFPQINPAAHNVLGACIDCHNPHKPESGETPKECAACHGEIEKTKSLSSHATLSCSTCHEITDEHKTNPRRASASKPELREFCGKCHGPDAPVKGPPKVDIAKHGEKYLCWECHYPHLPEVK
jgi:hypothetical protein